MIARYVGYDAAATLLEFKIALFGAQAHKYVVIPAKCLSPEKASAGIEGDGHPCRLGSGSQPGMTIRPAGFRVSARNDGIASCVPGLSSTELAEVSL